LHLVGISFPHLHTRIYGIQILVELREIKIRKYKIKIYMNILMQSALNRHTVRLLTEGDDTRGCADTIGPPGDEQRAA